MKVVIPTNSEHDINLIPRYSPDAAIVLTLYNEVTKVETVVANTYVIENGILTITFTFTFADKDKYQFTLIDGTELVYRGKITATSQTPQDFKLTSGLFYYE